MNKKNNGNKNYYKEKYISDFGDYFVDSSPATIKKLQSYLRTFIKFIEEEKQVCVINFHRLFKYDYEDFYKLIVLINDFFDYKKYENETIKQYIIMINHLNAFQDNAFFHLKSDNFYGDKKVKTYKPITEKDLFDFRELIFKNPYENTKKDYPIHFKEYEIRKYRNLFIFTTLFYTGINIDQLLNLKFKDINFQENIIYVDFIEYPVQKFLLEDLKKYHELANAGQFVHMLYDDFVLPKRYHSMTRGKIVFGEKVSKFGHINEKTINYTLKKLKERYSVSKDFSPRSLRRNRMYFDFFDLTKAEFIAKYKINQHRYSQIKHSYTTT